MTRIWPVIHLSTPEMALQNARLAEELGAHGVFLIHMDGWDDQIDPVAARGLKECPRLNLGVNYLSLPAKVAVERSLRLGYHATWSDSPIVRSDYLDTSAQEISDLLKHQAHRFFASVAFKYQKIDPNPGLAAERALSLGMTPTTSGEATGHAPSSDKLEKIRDVIGKDASLALASGVTPENASVFAPCLTDILVSTGISSSFYEFDRDLLESLLLVCKKTT